MDFLTIGMGVAVLLLIWDCVEVGRNDAANLINAAFGARVLQRRTAIWLSGIAVVLGAAMASPVMETARSGIFDPGLLTVEKAVAVYVSVYIVDTLLLYGYSAFGMPVSTTASLIFELVGASIAVAASIGIVHWDKVWEVLIAIVVSIFLAGLAGFTFQRIFRAAIRDRSDDPVQVLLHGPWIVGLLLTGLSWFMVTKGLRSVPGAKVLQGTLEAYGPALSLSIIWGGFTLLIHLILTATRQRGARHLFRVTTILGMLCMAFAFGQNDLANCASPGLAAFWLWRHASTGAAAASKVPISIWALAGCGLLMALGMSSRNAQRVTRAAVNTGSQFDHIALYAPGWCRKLAKFLLRGKSSNRTLAPPPQLDASGKRLHFDPLRASVIMSISASVIAFASSRGLPVSTTYVAFAAVIATGMADRVMSYGDADLKIGRAIWVVFSWFFSAIIAVVAAAITATVVVRFSILGLFLMLIANFVIRIGLRRWADRHEARHHEDLSRRLRLENLPPEPAE
ncbi:MAG: inorganic phosphate transporter [Kiritimatiellia bacterium]|nr:inorganic phosphate transporter [Kiritimatiellia bacterium]